MKPELYFGRIDFSALFAETLKRPSDEELGKWIRTVAGGLVANVSSDEFADSILTEARNSRQQKSNSGKLGAEVRYGKKGDI